MKIAFLFSHWACGARPLDFNQLWTSERSMTGSDLGIVMTAKEMASLGHDVSLFTSHASESFPSPWEGIKLYHIRDADGVINSNPFDAVVSWSDPEPLQNLSTKAVRVVCQMLNDFSYCAPGFDNAVDVWTAPCQMLIDHLMKQPNSPPKEKFNVLPLGGNPNWYSDQRVPGRVISASSPDRSLFWLLQEWPKIKKAVPYASLRIFYNFNYDSVEHMEPNSNNHPDFLELGHRARYCKETIKRLKNFGVEHIGGINRERMHKEMSEASVLAFPADCIKFSEGWSCSTTESLGSYTVAVISGADCLQSIYENSGAVVIPAPIKNHLQEFTDAVIKSLIDKNYADDRIEKSLSWAKEHTWEKATKKLEQLIIKNSNTFLNLRLNE